MSDDGRKWHDFKIVGRTGSIARMEIDGHGALDRTKAHAWLTAHGYYVPENVTYHTVTCGVAQALIEEREAVEDELAEAVRLLHLMRFSDTQPGTEEWSQVDAFLAKHSEPPARLSQEGG